MTIKTPNLPAVRSQGTAVEVIRPGGALVSRVSGEAVRHLPNITKKTYRVGDYDVNEQSYRQIMVWLDQIKAAGEEMTLEEFVAFQEADSDWSSPNHWVINGKIVRANLAFFKLAELDLSFVPDLIELDCARNKLTKLDVSRVPNLVRLWCGRNQLSRLDLSNLPKLNYLSCYKNQLTALDLAYSPNLAELWCDTNRLTTLDLSRVPNLISLGCGLNWLTELNLFDVPALTDLWCYDNDLAQLDLSSVPRLSFLDCKPRFVKNLITELDIRGCATNNFSISCDPQVTIRKRPDQNVKHP